MATRIIFALTLLMIAVHGGEWVLLVQLGRTANRGRPPSRSPFTRALGLMNFLRFEAFYYLVLVAFWLFDPGAVPGLWVFVLGAIHLGGWLAIEARKSLPQLEAVVWIAARRPDEEGGRQGLLRALRGIAAFDAVEVVVLAYIAYRLWIHL
jgi:hypothetical protein